MWNLLSRHVWQYTTFLALNTCRALYIFLPQMSHICSSKCFRSNSISSLISCLSFFFFVSSSLLEVVMIVSNDANTHLPPMSIVKTESAEVIEAAKKSPRKTKARKSWKSEASTAASNSKSRTKTTSAAKSATGTEASAACTYTKSSSKAATCKRWCCYCCCHYAYYQYYYHC